MDKRQESKKDSLRGAYSQFLKSAAGQDLLQQAEMLEKAMVLDSIRQETVEGKALSIAKLEGLLKLRDYILRMSK